MTIQTLGRPNRWQVCCPIATMGNLQPVACQRHQQENIPIDRPFKASRCKRTRVSAPILKTGSSVSQLSTMLKLILAQDWQRVLCRIALYPTELSQYMMFPVTPQNSLWILPLHLACALDPPSLVIITMLDVFMDAIATPVRPVKSKKCRNPVRRHAQATKPIGSNRQYHALFRRYSEWRRYRKGAFPTTPNCSDETSEHQNTPESRLLSDDVDDDGSVFVSAVQDNESSSSSSLGNTQAEDSCLSAPSSSPASVALQLHVSRDEGGGARVRPLGQGDTTRVGDCIFRMHWSWDPLLEHVLHHGSLLALHIGCMYSASPEVICVLAEAFPWAVRRSVVGMMPIHWIAAGWTLPPMISTSEPALTTSSELAPINTLPVALEVLEILKQVAPDTVQARSALHDMTPYEYLLECMQDSEYKKRSLEVVKSHPKNVAMCDHSQDHPHVHEEECTDTFEATSSEDDNDYHADDSEGDSKSFQPAISLSSLWSARDWEGMLAVIESSPSLSARWIYGIDETACTVWKRLPLHLIYASSEVPIGLASILLEFYPDAAYAVDLMDGSTPLHIACRSSVSFNVLRLLLTKGPEACGMLDVTGRVPLHWAVKTKASYEAIEALVAEHPHAVSVADLDNQTPIDLANHIYGENHIIYEFLSMIYYYMHDPTL
jgi:Ankyrin repeats (3 copies)